MSVVEPLWASDMREMSRALVEAESPQAGLSALCRITVRALPTCDHAGVTIIDGGRPKSRGATDPLILAIDAAQHEARNGPSVDAARDNKIVRCPDVFEARHQWPDFSHVALGAGIASTLSMPLSTGDEALGALNCYSGLVGAFGPEDELVAAELAARASVLLMAVVPMWDGQATIEQLGRAVTSRQVIGQATGILMARDAISSEVAFAILRLESASQKRKLRDIAAEIVEGSSPVGDAALSISDGRDPTLGLS